MPSVFSQIIAGHIPARFIWKDPECVAFLDIRPLRPGHTLVVPRQEVPHWIDLPPDLCTHVFAVSQEIGLALNHAFHPEKVGLVIAGLDVAHTHIHLVPIQSMRDLDFRQADRHPRPEDLDAAAIKIRTALRTLGSRYVVD
jgi:histidine triad (HIT) family protein